MSISYVRPPCNPDGSRMSYAQRRAERKQQEAENHAAQKGEPTRAAIFDLPADERRRLRQAEEQGRREGEQRAAIEEQSRQQAEFDATPEHERRPRNQWRDLIEKRKPDAWRKDVAHRIKIYEREAKREDERIDALMAEQWKRHELESAPEYARALAHWDRASMNAESEAERQQFARLKGIIDGSPNQYWDEVAPIMQARYERAKSQLDEQIGKQAIVVGESKAMAEALEAVSELQIQEATETLAGV